MALPSSGQISILDIATELGISATNESLQSLAGKTLNDCSSAQPSTSAPYSLSDWYEYDHSATPPAPPGLTATMDGGSIVASNHDRDLLIKSSTDVLCATTYEIHRSTTEFGTYTRIVTTPDISTGYEDTALGAEVQRWYKVRSLGATATGSFSSAFTGKTGPTSPKSFNATNGSGDTDDYTVDPQWNNGNVTPGSLGDRDMDALEWRRNVNGGSWTSWTTISAGSVTFSDNILSAGLVDGDLINYELRYTVETVASSATHTAVIPV